MQRGKVKTKTHLEVDVYAWDTIRCVGAATRLRLRQFLASRCARWSRKACHGFAGVDRSRKKTIRLNVRSKGETDDLVKKNWWWSRYFLNSCICPLVWYSTVGIRKRWKLTGSFVKWLVTLRFVDNFINNGLFIRRDTLLSIESPCWTTIMFPRSLP